MITTACADCGKVFNLSDEKAGKRGKCACGAIIHIPALSSHAKPAVVPVPPALPPANTAKQAAPRMSGWKWVLRGGLRGGMDDQLSFKIGEKDYTGREVRGVMTVVSLIVISVFVYNLFQPPPKSTSGSSSHQPTYAPASPSYTPSYSSPSPAAVVQSSPAAATDADKASYMRDHGFTSMSTSDLARMYDRVQAGENATAERDQRLGR